MKMLARRAVGPWLTSVALLAACGSSSPAPAASADAAAASDTTPGSDSTAGTDGAAGSDGAGGSDAVAGTDATAAPDSDADSATADAASDAAADASGKTTAWGPISGSCGVLGPELKSTAPSFIVNTWHFDKSGPFDPAPLRIGAKKRYDGPNAGGSSKCSEVMSMQMLHECDGAVTLKPEVEITYDSQGSITDWLASFGGVKIGVSVSRAYKGPTVNTYTLADADTLLGKKLKGILEATANVSAADKWQKQILHIWTLRADWVPILQQSWEKMDAALKADTILLVTVEEGSDSVVKDTCQ